MSSAPAAPIRIGGEISSTGDLIKNSLAIYRQIFWKFLGLGLLPILGALPLSFIVVIFFLKLNGASGVSPLTIILGILCLAGLFLVIYIGLASQAGLIILLRNFSANRMDEKFKQTFQEARTYVGAYFFVSFLAGILVLLWSLLFIIPGIIYGVFYCLAAFALILENHRSMAALKRSQELIKGYWWAVVLRYLAVGLITLVAFWVLSMPLAAFTKDSIIYNGWSFIINIFNFLVGQVYLIYSYLIFKDLVRIKGGSQEAGPTVN